MTRNIIKELDLTSVCEERTYYDQGEVDAFQNQYNIQLPASLLFALKEIGSAVMCSKIFKPIQSTGLTGDDAYLDILSFYCGALKGSDSLGGANKTFAGRMSPDLVVIADASGGDQICIDVKTSKVYYWRHDACEGELSEILIADSFDAFIDRLETPVEPERMEFTDAEIAATDARILRERGPESLERVRKIRAKYEKK
ncbi:SMI1/KNR4 family protein [Persicirhabdus sediminis]|uniref:SMI1/KNR4 family protein n=1 Tax=Persicirhabdus sediminis TaxID=454144 RepID=A0A8J7MDV5_9BACT|nr:SMI1/KNR4 family protein [Persicirhabdus sediminis]MBK1790876.1 SMI1/KNR4 family protein [Persicirhabdus sediminis]